MDKSINSNDQNVNSIEFLDKSLSGQLNICKSNPRTQEIERISKFFNLDYCVIEECVEGIQSLEDMIEVIVNKIFCDYLVSGLGVIYSILEANGIIEHSYFLYNYMSLQNTVLDAIVCVYRNDLVQRIHSYVVRHKFLNRNIDYFYKIIIKKAKPFSKSLEVDYIVQNEELFDSRHSIRQDGLIIIGCDKSSHLIDLNLYNSSNAEQALCVLISDNSGLYISDFSSKITVGLNIKEYNLTKGCILRLANDFFIEILDLRCAYYPYIAIKAFDTNKIYKFENQESLIRIGSSKIENLQIRTNCSGVSKTHCEISYNNLHWILKDKNSTNGTWLMIKNMNENINELPSYPKLLTGNTNICIGPQQLLLDFES
jgi:FHA domain